MAAAGKKTKGQAALLPSLAHLLSLALLPLLPYCRYTQGRRIPQAQWRDSTCSTHTSPCRVRL